MKFIVAIGVVALSTRPYIQADCPFLSLPVTWPNVDKETGCYI